MRTMMSACLLAAVLVTSACAGDPADLCGQAVMHLRSCGATEVVAPDVCNEAEQQAAGAVLAQDCDGRSTFKSGSATKSVTLRGRLTRSSASGSSPASQVPVELAHWFCWSGNCRRTTTSGADGRYSFATVPEGSYTLRILGGASPQLYKITVKMPLSGHLLELGDLVIVEGSPKCVTGGLLDPIKKNPAQAKALCAELRQLSAQGHGPLSQSSVQQVATGRGLCPAAAEVIITYVIAMYCPDLDR